MMEVMQPFNIEMNKTFSCVNCDAYSGISINILVGKIVI